MAIKQLPSNNWEGGKRPNTGAPLPESLVPGGESDSAGFPWQGRTFEHHGTAFADDSGETPAEYKASVQNLRLKVRALAEASADPEPDKNGATKKLLSELAEAHAETVASLAKNRFLVPLVAEAGEYGTTPEGRIVEKSQELSIVTVAGPDGRKVMPVFSSSEAMQNWKASARPIPVPGGQVAVAAAQEETDLVIIDPGFSDTEFGVRRTALESFALGKKHTPSWANSKVLKEFQNICLKHGAVKDVFLAPGDPQARLLGPETVVGLKLIPGLNETQLRSVLESLQTEFSTSDTILQLVDSMTIQVLS